MPRLLIQYLSVTLTLQACIGLLGWIFRFELTFVLLVSVLAQLLVTSLLLNSTNKSRR